MQPGNRGPVHAGGPPRGALLRRTKGLPAEIQGRQGGRGGVHARGPKASDGGKGQQSVAEGALFFIQLLHSQICIL